MLGGEVTHRGSSRKPQRCSLVLRTSRAPSVGGTCKKPGTAWLCLLLSPKAFFTALGGKLCSLGCKPRSSLHPPSRAVVGTKETCPELSEARSARWAFGAGHVPSPVWCSQPDPVDPQPQRQTTDHCSQNPTEICTCLGRYAQLY